MEIWKSLFIMFSKIKNRYKKYKSDLLHSLDNIIPQQQQQSQHVIHNDVHFLSDYFQFICQVDPLMKNIILTFSDFNNVQDWCWDKIIRIFTTMYPNALEMMTPVNHILVRIYKFNGIGFTVDGPTKGSKIVHVSSNYIASLPADAQLFELDGVVCHELVHAFQYDGNHTAPSGFIEGIADFYRMHIGLAAKHWDRKQLGIKWDAGYEKTGFFLSWVNMKYPGSVNQLNLYLKTHNWFERDPFEYVTGKKVKVLFEEYIRESVRF